MVICPLYKLYLILQVYEKTITSSVWSTTYPITNTLPDTMRNVKPSQCEAHDFVISITT